MKWIRVIVSLSLLFISIISAISGIMLLVMPKGRVGVNRRFMTDVHTVSSIIALGLSLIHIYLNINAIIHYFKMIFRMK